MATNSILAGVSLSKHRHWSFPRGGVFLLLFAGAFSAAIELFLEFCPMAESDLTFRMLKLLFSVSIGSLFAFFIASVSLFVVVCVEAFCRFRYRRYESTDA
jgi:hypothetical protein